MCGIAGFLGFRGLGTAEVSATATRMADAIRHRGPDDSGVWYDPGGQVALAHRRLSILDLSAAGHQPMKSGSGRFVMVYNGEVYNHAELRHSLEALGYGVAGSAWRGHSDTETLLAGFEAWGIESTLRRCIGMFALAVWDQNEQALFLARDRMGEKPLYAGWQQGVFLFGSELKAIRQHPAFVGEIDRQALACQVQHCYIATPRSIYQGIGKLPPGTLLRIDASALHKSSQPGVESARAYWSFAAAALHQRSALSFQGTDAQAIDTLEELLKEAVARQMVADVPLGAFLSGGIDSSTVVALMQAQSTRPIKTFTIGFHESGYNEAVHAKAVAQHLGTEHTELYVTAQQALSVINRLPDLYDEPFADSSQIPTYLVSELARRHVTVSLSGDGGDELFGGYYRYTATQQWWRRINYVPAPVRRALASALVGVGAHRWARLGAWTHMPKMAHWVGRLTGVLGVQTESDLYKQFITHWNPAEVLLDHVPEQRMTPDILSAQGLPIIEQMMMQDSQSYLPDDILAKVDRAAMSVSLETRVPFLDHRVVELAWRLPMSMKVRDGVGKWALRQVLYRHVPKALIERPKMGFGVPIDSWLRGPLRDWAEALLSESRLRREGYFNPVPIRQKWTEHLSGARNWQYHLWDILMFQVWLEKCKCDSA